MFVAGCHQLHVIPLYTGILLSAGSYQRRVAEPLNREHRITLLSDRRLLGRSRFVSWPDNCCDDKADQEPTDDYIDDKHRGVETVEVHPVIVCDMAHQR